MGKVLTARARRLDNGEWVIGYLILFRGKTYILLGDEDAWCLICGDRIEPEWIEIDPATIGYETGRVDCNGNMIYEGMKVRRCSGLKCLYDVVLFEPSEFRLTIADCTYIPFSRFDEDDLEIVKEKEGE